MSAVMLKKTVYFSLCGASQPDEIRVKYVIPTRGPLKILEFGKNKKKICLIFLCALGMSSSFAYWLKIYFLLKNQLKCFGTTLENYKGLIGELQLP